MSDFERAGEALATFVKTYVPLASAAALQVDSYDGSTLVLSAPLDKNINDKGTAFGGSLYNICVIAAWGMTHLKAKELGLDGDIVVAKGEINYLRPLVGRLIASATSPDQEAILRAEQGFKDRGKAIFTINVTVKDDQQMACVEFVGKYAVLANDK